MARGRKPRRGPREKKLTREQHVLWRCEKAKEGGAEVLAAVEGAVRGASRVQVERMYTAAARHVAARRAARLAAEHTAPRAGDMLHWGDILREYAADTPRGEALPTRVQLWSMDTAVYMFLRGAGVVPSDAELARYRQAESKRRGREAAAMKRRDAREAKARAARARVREEEREQLRKEQAAAAKAQAEAREAREAARGRKAKETAKVRMAKEDAKKGAKRKRAEASPTATTTTTTTSAKRAKAADNKDTATAAATTTTNTTVTTNATTASAKRAKTADSKDTATSAKRKKAADSKDTAATATATTTTTPGAKRTKAAKAGTPPRKVLTAPSPKSKGNAVAFDQTGRPIRTVEEAALVRIEAILDQEMPKPRDRAGLGNMTEDDVDKLYVAMKSYVRWRRDQRIYTSNKGRAPVEVRPNAPLDFEHVHRLYVELDPDELHDKSRLSAMDDSVRYKVWYRNRRRRMQDSVPATPETTGAKSKAAERGAATSPAAAKSSRKPSSPGSASTATATTASTTTTAVATTTTDTDASSASGTRGGGGGGGAASSKLPSLPPVQVHHAVLTREAQLLERAEAVLYGVLDVPEQLREAITLKSSPVDIDGYREVYRAVFQFVKRRRDARALGDSSPEMCGSISWVDIRTVYEELEPSCTRSHTELHRIDDITRDLLDPWLERAHKRLRTGAKMPRSAQHGARGIENEEFVTARGSMIINELLSVPMPIDKIMSPGDYKIMYEALKEYVAWRRGLRVRDARAKSREHWAHYSGGIDYELVLPYFAKVAAREAKNATPELLHRAELSVRQKLLDLRKIKDTASPRRKRPEGWPDLNGHSSQERRVLMAKAFKTGGLPAKLTRREVDETEALGNAKLVMEGRIDLGAFVSTPTRHNVPLSESDVLLAYRAVDLYVRRSQHMRAPFLPADKIDKPGQFAISWTSVFRIYKQYNPMVVHRVTDIVSTAAAVRARLRILRSYEARMKKKGLM